MAGARLLEPADDGRCLQGPDARPPGQRGGDVVVHVPHAAESGWSGAVVEPTEPNELDGRVGRGLLGYCVAEVGTAEQEQPGVSRAGHARAPVQY